MWRPCHVYTIVKGFVGTPVKSSFVWKPFWLEPCWFCHCMGFTIQVTVEHLCSYFWNYVRCQHPSRKPCKECDDEVVTARHLAVYTDLLWASMSVVACPHQTTACVDRWAPSAGKTVTCYLSEFRLHSSFKIVWICIIWDVDMFEVKLGASQ